MNNKTVGRQDSRTTVENCFFLNQIIFHIERDHQSVSGANEPKGPDYFPYQHFSQYKFNQIYYSQPVIPRLIQILQLWQTNVCTTGKKIYNIITLF